MALVSWSRASQGRYDARDDGRVTRWRDVGNLTSVSCTVYFDEVPGESTSERVRSAGRCKILPGEKYCS